MHSIFELSLAKLLHPKQSDLQNLYEEFCDQEYPRIGEMHTFNGFLDYLKLRSTREQELILVKAKDEFIVERGIKSENDEEWS